MAIGGERTCRLLPQGDPSESCLAYSRPLAVRSRFCAPQKARYAPACQWLFLCDGYPLGGGEVVPVALLDQFWEDWFGMVRLPAFLYLPDLTLGAS